MTQDILDPETGSEGNLDFNFSTIDYYDKFADDFEKIPFDKTIQDLFTTYSPKTEKGCINVLDVGSGPGSLANWINHAGYQVTCLDPSKEMVRRCKQKGLIAIQGSLDDLKTDQQFHTILAISSFIHVPKADFRDHIKKIYSLLSPSGLFFISMLLGEGEGCEDPLEKGVKRYFSYINNSDLVKIFTEELFSVLEVKKIEVKKMNKCFDIYVLKK